MKKWIGLLGVVVLVGALIWQWKGKVGHASSLSPSAETVESPLRVGDTVPGAGPLEAGDTETDGGLLEAGDTETDGGLLEAGDTEEREGLHASGGTNIGGAPMELSDAVKRLSGEEGTAFSYEEMLEALRQLETLNAAEVAALRDMLAVPVETFTKMRPIEANAIKNDVLDHLTKMEDFPVGLGGQVAAMATDPEMDAVWRDYCVQFLEPCYARLSEGLTVEGQRSEEEGEGISNIEHDGEQATDLMSNIEGIAAELEAVQSALFEALGQSGHESTAGTALIGLASLAGKTEAVDEASILEKAVAMAGDESLDPGSRLTALRMSVERMGTGDLMLEAGDQEQPTARENILEVARLLAQTGESDMLRSGALVTLGELGAEEDLELLRSFALSQNRQIAAAAKMGLETYAGRQ